MPHDTTLIATIAISLAYAFLGGFIAFRLKLPPLVGYLLAGLAVGPFTPGFVADAELTAQLAEIGVILLMFGVGMHFSVRDLLAVRSIALPGAVAQILVATALGAGVATLWGWPLGAGLVLGLALSVASTVVLLRALDDQGVLHSDDGRIAVGWLIVEDLVMVLVLVLLPPIAASLGGAGGTDTAGPGLGTALALTLLKVGAFVAVMLVAGPRILPWVLQKVEDTRSPEMFTLGVVAIAIGVAFGSALLFGVSFALGAFFAGVVINESDAKHRVEKRLRPFQDAFAVLFFVAVGMLFDPAILVEEPLRVLAVLAIILVGKTVAAICIVLVLGQSRRTALTVSAALAQIGEFSFILAGMGLTLAVLPEAGLSYIVAGALLSITLNPLVFRLATRLA
ncbi:MAG: cation:proton antiporter [Chromatiales bacterium]|nr:cation:proton antiporter [Chromatiales bacterium]